MNITKQITLSTIICLFNAPFVATAERTNFSDFFIKANISANIFNDAKQYEGIKLKSQITPATAVGLGYYIQDNFRIDLTFEHYFTLRYKKQICNNHPEHGTFKLKQSPQLSALLINTSIDIVDFDPVKLFVTGGIGIAKHKTKYLLSGVDIDGDPVDDVISTKTSRNLAYSIGTGFSFDLSECVNAEITYLWKNFGSTKPMKNEDGENISRKMTYSTHNVSVGLRIDL